MVWVKRTLKTISFRTPATGRDTFHLQVKSGCSCAVSPGEKGVNEANSVTIAEQSGSSAAKSSRNNSLVFGRMEASCLELALEGERLCKAGDFKAGAAFFEAAVQVGTEDLKTLSAIYSQLGNAYFYLHEYAKALEYHHHDLTLAR